MRTGSMLVPMLVAAVICLVVPALGAPVEIREGQPFVFNFGPDNMAPAPGAVNAGSRQFDASRGWGWEKPADILRKRDKDADPMRDTLAAASDKVQPEAVFMVELEPGTYTVDVIIGDPGFRYTAKLYLQDERTPWIDEGLRQAGDFLIRSRAVNVADGRLRVRLPGAPTRGTAYAVINALSIRRGGVAPAREAAAPAAAVPAGDAKALRVGDEPLVINFGPADAPAPGATIISGTTPFRPGAGWGWENPADILRKRDRNADPIRDTLAAASPKAQPEAVFVVQLEPGSYVVEAVMGDAQHRYTAQLFLQSERAPWINEGVKPGGEFVVKRRTVELPDGRLRVRLAAPETTGTPYACLAALRIVRPGMERMLEEGRPQSSAPSPPVVPARPRVELASTGPGGARLLPGDIAAPVIEATPMPPGGVRHVETTVDPDQMLPPAAQRGEFSRADHPLAETFNVFLRDREAFVDTVQATGLEDVDYLRLIDGVVQAMVPYQDDSGGENDGEIVDPWFRPGEYRHYATPHFAYCVGVLYTSGHNRDAALLERGVRAFGASVNRMVIGRRGPDNPHGLQPWSSADFYTVAMMRALPLYDGLVPEEQYARWVRGLAAVDPDILYAQKFVHNNWSVLNGCGEFMRAAAGLTDMAWTERTLALHRPGIDAYGMFAAEPFAYDVFPRYYLSGILQAGYRGEHFEYYRERMWRGAWITLFFQTPHGQLVTGSRSAHHCWNEAQMCALFEMYATAYKNAGMEREAAIFKRAARLSLDSMGYWLNDDGSFCVVKNRIGPDQGTGQGAGHGYEPYTQHSCYNLLAASMLAMAWQVADNSVPEAPAPADVGGFAFLVEGKTQSWFAAVANTYVQYSIRGDGRYDPTGLQRIHMAGTSPILAPSDGIGRRFGDGQSVYAVGPGWEDVDAGAGNIAEKNVAPLVRVVEQSPGRTVLEAQYRVSGAADVPAGRGRVGGVLHGGVPAGGALDFSEAAGYLRTRDTFSLDGDFTFSMRFRQGNRRGPQTLVAIHQESNLRGHMIIAEVHPNQRLRFLYRVPPGTTGGVDVYGDGSALTGNGWHHLAFGRDGDVLRLWLDGHVVGEEPAGNSTADEMTAVVGRLFQDRDDRQWTGGIDDVRLYAAALDEEAVRALAAGTDPPGAGATIHWPLDSFDRPDELVITERVEITPGAVEVTNTFDGQTRTNRFFYPVIVNDGREDVRIPYNGRDRVIALGSEPARGVRVRVLEPGGMELVPMGLRLLHENGWMDILRGETQADTIRVRIERAEQ